MMPALLTVLGLLAMGATAWSVLDVLRDSI